MKITFDPVKSARNIEERGLSFGRATDFEFETAGSGRIRGGSTPKHASSP
jgi:uncharacterized DUF497 family protein